MPPNATALSPATGSGPSPRIASTRRLRLKAIGQIGLNLLLLAVGSLLVAVAVNGILVPQHFLSGGLTGLALGIHYLDQQVADGKPARKKQDQSPVDLAHRGFPLDEPPGITRQEKRCCTHQQESVERFEIGQDGSIERAGESEQPLR